MQYLIMFCEEFKYPRQINIRLKQENNRTINWKIKYKNLLNQISSIVCLRQSL